VARTLHGNANLEKGDTIMKTFSDTAEQASEQLKDTFIDVTNQATKLLGSLRDAEGRGLEALLDRLGLQRKQSALTPALWFAAGAVAAGAAVFILAPTSGKTLRERLAAFFSDEADEAVTAASSLEKRVEETVKNEAASLKNTPNGAKYEVSR
jgi:acyl-CoA synthetase (AMP-forming)/AMP-acid ligase II